MYLCIIKVCTALKRNTVVNSIHTTESTLSTAMLFFFVILYIIAVHFILRISNKINNARKKDDKDIFFKKNAFGKYDSKILGLCAFLIVLPTYSIIYNIYSQLTDFDDDLYLLYCSFLFLIFLTSAMFITIIASSVGYNDCKYDKVSIKIKGQQLKEGAILKDIEYLQFYDINTKKLTSYNKDLVEYILYEGKY